MSIRLPVMKNMPKDYLPDPVDTTDLFNVMSNHDVSGEGKINRAEKINMTMAAVVTQVLPNDNLVIEGTQKSASTMNSAS